VNEQLLFLSLFAKERMSNCSLILSLFSKEQQKERLLFRSFKKSERAKMNDRSFSK